MAKNVYGAGIKFFVEEAASTIQDEADIKEGFDAVRQSAGDAAVSVDDINSRVLVLKEAFQLLGTESQRLRGFGMGVLKGFVGIGTEIAMAGDRLDQTRRQFGLAFGDADLANEKLKAAQDVAARTNLETVATLQQVVTYQRLGIDGLKTYNGQWMKNGQIVKGQIGTLELVSDLINGSGQDAQNVFRNLSFAARGQARNFMALFDGAQTKAETTAFKAAKTAQERMDVLMQTTLRLFGGISKTTEGTFGFIMDNIGDVTNLFKADLGEKILPAITPLLGRLLEFISGLQENKAFMGSLVGAVESIIGFIAPMAKAFLDTLDYVRDLIAANPQLVEFATRFAFIGSVVLVVAGTVGSLIASLGLFVTIILPAIKAGLVTLSVAAFPALILFAKIALAIAAVVAIVEVARRAYESNFGGIRDVIDKVRLGFLGILEVVRNWKDGTSSMSKETADNLEKAGILGFVIKVGGFIGSMVDMFKRMGMAVWESMKQLMDATAPIREALSEAFLAIGEAIGVFVTALGGQAGPALRGTKRDISGFKAVLDILVSVIGATAKSFAFVVRVVMTVVGPALKVIAFLIGTVVGWVMRLTDWIRTGAMSWRTSFDEMVQSIRDWWEGNVQPILDSARIVFDAYVRFLERAGTWIWSHLKGPWDKFRNLISGFFSWYVGLWSSGYEWILNNVWNPFMDTLTKGWNEFKSGFTQVWETLKTNVWDPFSEILDAILEKIGMITDTIPDLPSLPSANDVAGFFDSAGDFLFGPEETAANQAATARAVAAAATPTADDTRREGGESREAARSLAKIAEALSGGRLKEAFEDAMNNVNDRDPGNERR